MSSPRQAGAALIALAHHLSSTCTTQLQRARVCMEWLASHLTPPPKDEGPTSVTAPLFAPISAEGDDAWGAMVRPPDYLLIRGQQGTWAERAATLFCVLAKACELEAVVIAGYCKGVGEGRVGETMAAHNHCWAGRCCDTHIHTHTRARARKRDTGWKQWCQCKSRRRSCRAQVSNVFIAQKFACVCVCVCVHRCQGEWQVASRGSCSVSNQVRRV